MQLAVIALILVKPFHGARTKAMKYCVISYLVVVHNSTNDLQSVNSPEEFANKIISFALSVKEKDHQIAVWGIVDRSDRNTMFGSTM